LRKLLAFVFLAGLAFAGWLTWGIYAPMQPSGQKTLLLHPGWSARRIATELKAAGVVRSTTAFMVWHRLHPRWLRAGEYGFVNAASIPEIHARIVRGDFLIRTVVVPEGYTMFDVATAVEDAGLGKREDFLKVAQTETSLVSDFAPNAKSLEGFLFPDTYQFNRTQSMEDIASAMVHRFRKEAESLGLKGDILPLVTMASIVEKETGNSDERNVVASVYYNRLQKKIALDADPTVIYAHLLDGTYKGALHHSDMEIKSPYNTYRYPGMPPGPIGNPGHAALAAAMQPATSDYLFFVADGNGHHRFARNLQEHNRNVAKFRQAVAANHAKNL
jgi:UPF0755 protein